MITCRSTPTASRRVNSVLLSDKDHGIYPSRNLLKCNNDDRRFSLYCLNREIHKGGINNFGQTVYWKESKVAYLKNLFTILLVSGMFISIGFLFFVLHLRKL